MAPWAEDDAALEAPGGPEVILRLTYRRPSGPVDLEATIEADTTVGELARSLARLDPERTGSEPSAELTLAIVDGRDQRAVDPATTVAASTVVSGCSVALSRPDHEARSSGSPAPAAVVEVVHGPDTGARLPLHRGTNYIGRGADADVRLRDDTVSKSHAKINVADSIEIIDNNSSNGITIGGVQVARAMVQSTDVIELGDSSIRIRATQAAPARTQAAPDPRFVRPPRILPVFADQQVPAPEIPTVPEPQALSLVAMITPLFVGAALFAVTQQPATLIFVLMSPLMVLGQWVESRFSRRRGTRRAKQRFTADLDQVRARVTQLQGEELASRRRENPSGAEAGEAISNRTAMLWSRQPGDSSFLTLRLGLGTAASRVSVERSSVGGRDQELEAALREAADELSVIVDAPIVADLKATAIGVGGSRELGAAVVRSLVIQVAALHAPEDVTVAACVSSEAVDMWDWLKWLPHASSGSSPVDVPTVTAGPGGAGVLVAALEELMSARLDESPSSPDRDWRSHVVLVVTDDAPIDRGRLVDLARRGADAGIHVLWHAPSADRLPAACRAYVSIEGERSAAGFVEEALEVVPLAAERVDFADTLAWARALAPVVDAGSLVLDESDLPRSVSFLSLADPGLGVDPASVVERWRESESLARYRRPGVRRKAGTLRALIGQSAAGPLTVDLRVDGPHALVGGTTGSGKSELLQTWVLAMAAAHSPERVTFLFVDYKGGSAFGDCVSLPHSVGLVTDLSPHLVRRALESLEAEVRHRERILNRARAKDLLDMEKSGHAETPPSLIIVVDEFAALVHEVPEFVDGVVNIAQRGRSLGLHLILATQRPAGVIKDNLRANTNLRIALRMADEEDSSDVLGTPDAAGFDPTAPGRAAARTGPGRLTAFQSAYVGGYTADGTTSREVSIRELSLVDPKQWEAVEDPDEVDEPRETDLQRTLRTITDAASLEAVAPPRRPWLPELPSVIDLADLASPRSDAELVFALADRPKDQAQTPVAFLPDLHGNLAIFGASGSGKTATLRSLTVAAGFTVRGGPVHVYGLDFAARGLQMLEAMPHVGAIVGGEDTERVARLLRSLRDLVNERAERYSQVNASTITDYRRDAGRPDEPRVLLLLDGLAAFRQAHDLGSLSGLFEILIAICADGRQVGVHVVLTADRPATVPSALNSLISRRLSLRLADDADQALLAVPPGVLTLASPPGRGYLDGQEMQVGVLGGRSATTTQAAAIARFARAMRKNTTWPAAPGVNRLPEDLRRESLPSALSGLPVLGMWDEDLAPATFKPEGTFVIVGPPSSGRTTALETVVRSAAARLGARVAVFTPARRPAADLRGLSCALVACGHDDAADAASQLADRLASDGDTPWVVVVENPSEFLNGPADLSLQDLLKAARNGNHFAVAEGETQSMAGSWPLLQAVRFSRRGLALQPDQTDGDLVFRTSFPRVRRSEFVPGRGLLVAEGRARRVQVAWSGGNR